MSSTVNYSKLTKEDFGKGLMEQIKPEYMRQYSVETGSRGIQMFHRAMERVTIDASIERLVQEGKLTVYELGSITKMLDSPDDRDYELAKLIIDSKL